jgi:replicative DNA helicase
VNTRNDTPSHDDDAERMLLAAYMLRGVDAQDEIESAVSEDDFYSQAKGTVYAALKALRARGAPTHTNALVNELTKTEKLAVVGGHAAVASLTDTVPPARGVEALCTTVARLGSVRRMQEAAGGVYAGGFGVAAHDANTYLDESGAKIQAAAERRQQVDTSAQLGDVAHVVIDRAMQAWTSGAKLTGTSTGFTYLDRLTTGMHGGELWVLGGRPGQGKSAGGQAIALKVAAEDNPTLILSLEMPKAQWAERALSSLSSVPMERIRSASFVNDDFDKLRAAEQMLKKLPIVCDDGSATVVDIRIKARRMKRKYGRLGLVVVDYLQLVRAQTKSVPREQVVAEISGGLKWLAKEIDVPVLALAQVNRAAEKNKGDKRPGLADLRESGAIEQDADLVMFVYRDEVYNKDTDAQGMGEFIVGKQRNGPTGTVHVEYVGECVRFQNAPEGRYGRR